MDKKIVITYEGEICDGWSGGCIGDTPLSDLENVIETLKKTGTKVKITVEYDY